MNYGLYGTSYICVCTVVYERIHTPSLTHILLGRKFNLKLRKLHFFSHQCTYSIPNEYERGVNTLISDCI